MSDCETMLLNKRRIRLQTPKRFKDKINKNEINKQSSVENLQKYNTQLQKNSLKSLLKITKNNLKPKRKSIKLLTNKIPKFKIRKIIRNPNKDQEEEIENGLHDEDMNTNFVFSENSEIINEKYTYKNDLISNLSFDSAKFSIEGNKFFTELQLSESTKYSEIKYELSVIQKQEEVTFFSVYERDIKVCSICLLVVNFEEKHYLRCGHIFHQKCISEWLKIKNICPNCKQSSHDNLNLLNDNLSLFSEEDFAEMFSAEDLMISRNYRENINDLNLIFEIVRRYRYWALFVIYAIFYLSYKVIFLMKTLANF